MQEEHISPAVKWHLSGPMINTEPYHLGTLKEKATCDMHYCSVFTAILHMGISQDVEGFPS